MHVLFVIGIASPVPVAHGNPVELLGALDRVRERALYGCSTVVLICFTCPAITVVTVILRALDRG